MCDYQNHHGYGTHGPLLSSQVWKCCDSRVLRYLVHNIRVRNKKKKKTKRIRKAKTEDLHCHADLITVLNQSLLQKIQRERDWLLVAINNHGYHSVTMAWFVLVTWVMLSWGSERLKKKLYINTFGHHTNDMHTKKNNRKFHESQPNILWLTRCTGFVMCQISHATATTTNSVVLHFRLLAKIDCFYCLLL